MIDRLARRLGRLAIVVSLCAISAAHALPRVSAQVQADDPVFALEARVCPSGYDDVAYRADCSEPLEGFAFDVAGPVDAEVTTDAEGQAEVGPAPLGTYAVEALDFDPDDGFAVECGRPARGGPFVADVTYTDAGFEIDLGAEYARDLPPSPGEGATLTCTWHSIPDPLDDELLGIASVELRRCDAADGATGVAVVEPGGEVDAVAERRLDCEVTPGTVTLTNDATGDETAVDVAGLPEDGPALTGVPAGTYTATVDQGEPSDRFAVDAGETTIVVATVAPVALEASVQPGPTAVPEPSAAPEPLATIEFAAGDWQDTFPNINTGVYDRAAVALYGALSPFPSAALRFDLPSAPTDGATLRIEGLADELGPAQIAISVNGVEVFRGDSGFAGWDPSAATPAWTAVDFTIPAEVFQAGANEILVANLADSAAVGLPPYVLLSVATLTFG